MSDIRYLQNGMRVHLIQKIESGGYLVKSHEDEYEPGDWEMGLNAVELISTPFWVDRIYDIPLLNSRESEAEKLREEIKVLKKKKSELIRNQEKELAEEKNEWNKKIEKLGKYSSLIDDMGLIVEGKITHVALLEDGYKKHYKVELWNDAKYFKASRYRSNFRMLSINGLRGEENGLLKSFSFRLSDWEGMNSCEVLFATSKEQAEDKIRVKLGELAASKKEYKNWFVKKCEEFGVELSGEKYDSYINALEREAKEKEEKKQKKKIELERQLAELNN